MTIENASAERVPELDLLRFLAASAMMVYHLMAMIHGPEFDALRTVTRFGFLGVPLFFMISGFVIFSTATTKSPGAFVISRIARLYPTFWVSVLITAAMLAAVSEQPTLSTVALNLTMIPKQFGAPLLDGVYWTLFIEIKFYALIWLLLMLGKIERHDLWLSGWVIVMGAAVAFPDSRILDSLNFGGYAPFFASGAYLFLLRRGSINPLIAVGLAVSTVLSVYSAIEVQEGFTRLRSDWAMLVVAGTVLALHGVFLAIALRVIRLPQHPALFGLGSITYPLYLIHNEAGRSLFTLLPETWGELARVVLVMGAALGLAALLAVYIDQRLCKPFAQTLAALGARLTKALPAMVRNQSTR